MKEITVGKNEDGKRFDKFLGQYFSEAGMGFLYKMLRKKNITLNKKKATGKEILKSGDVISVFFSDETFDKFSNNASDNAGEYLDAYKKIGSLKIIYEDDDVLFLNKPAGILTQKAKDGDLSVNEWLIGYLLSEGKIKESDLTSFRPSVCNRLDRNTSGLVICSKSLLGAREMARLLKDRTMHKFYRTIVNGEVTEDAEIEGYLLKDEKTNKVTLYKEEVKGSSYIKTSYHVIKSFDFEGRKFTLLEVELHTGKTHQIRAHLSSEGFSIIGDFKYGKPKDNAFIKEKLGLKYQLLHAYRLEFPKDTEIESLKGKEFIAEVPAIFDRIIND